MKVSSVLKALFGNQQTRLQGLVAEMLKSWVSMIVQVPAESAHARRKCCRLSTAVSSNRVSSFNPPGRLQDVLDRHRPRFAPGTPTVF